ncbi:MAG: hypothetical protein LOD94_09065 [Gammaproteobacteria bacterium]|nr:hypothetical protein [Gammaproteobacteria bacterium]
MSALKALIAGVGIGIAPMLSAVAQPADAPDVVAADDWGAVVVDVHYANAEELAAILAEILPAGVDVVPYYPTNSLIFSGSREALRALLGDDADEKKDDASEVETEAGPPAAIGITAHAR